MIGIMKTDIKLIATSLALQAGQRVILYPAYNLPQGGFFARPADGKWSDGLDHDVYDSILLGTEDFIKGG